MDSSAPSVDALKESLGNLKTSDGPNDNLGQHVLAAAKEDLAAKAVLKEIRSSTAALASVTPLDALSKVETRGEGVSAAVLQAAKEDRELKRNIPIEASQGIGSLKKNENTSGEGVGASTLAAAREDLAAKAVLKDVRQSTAALASVTPLEALSKVETRGEGISAAVLQAAKEDRELKRNLPIEASQGAGNLKKVENTSGEGVGASTLAAAREDIAAKALLKDVRQSTAALASVTPIEALSKVETRGEGLSTAVLEAAKADRELKRAIPRNAAVMASSESHLRQLNESPRGEGLSPALWEAAKQDLVEKRVVMDARQAVGAEIVSQGQSNLKSQVAPNSGLSPAVLEAAKLDRELKSSIPKEAASADNIQKLKHVENIQGEGISAATLAAAKEDIEAMHQISKTKKAVESGLAGALQSLNKVAVPEDGLSAAIISSAKEDMEKDKQQREAILQTRKDIAAELGSVQKQVD